MKTQMQKVFTLIELLVVITIIAILASLAVPTFGRIQERGNITKGISNARQIITALRIYSSDHSGNYPDIALEVENDDNTEGGDTSTANGYYANFSPTTSKIAKYTSGSASDVGTPVSRALAADTWSWARMRVEDGMVYLRWWADGETEPGTWNVSAADTSHTTKGASRFR